VLQNTGPTLAEAVVEFGWAAFGIGVPFTTTGMDPYTRTVQAAPGLTVTAWVSWTPAFSGPQCVMAKLIDPAGNYEELISRRNVDVVEPPPCDEARSYTLTVYNERTSPVLLDIGLISFDVPGDWQVSTVPSRTLELGPLTEETISVTVIIPCPAEPPPGGEPTIYVEGYVDGRLLGGIELRFVPRRSFIYLPIIWKGT
jgi:hypothetical protein